MKKYSALLILLYILFVSCINNTEAQKSKNASLDSTVAYNNELPITRAPKSSDFVSYLKGFKEADLPFTFSFKSIITPDSSFLLDTKKVVSSSLITKYYQIGKEVEKLPGTYLGSIAYPYLRVTVNDNLHALLYAFYKEAEGYAYYPYVELLTYNKQGNILDRKIVASGYFGEGHWEEMTFSVSKDYVVNINKHIKEYADVEMEEPPINNLKLKEYFKIQDNGKLEKLSNK